MEILEPDGAGNTLLAAALRYAHRGWLVFPCRTGGKEPVTRNGFYAATANSATIKRWWRAQPYNVAIRTGPESGLWVVDLDGGELDELPPTLEAETNRGRHLYFAEPGLDLPSTTKRIGPGIDTRGRGGYVI